MSAGFALAGCAAKIEKPKDEPKPPITQQVATRAAEGLRYSVGSEASPRKPLWRVKWVSANLTYSETGDFHGEMFGVSGALFRAGKEASAFKADTAKVDQESNILRLRGNVSVETDDPPGKVLCQSAVWYPEREVGEAQGNVRFVSKDYSMGPFALLMFSPELKAIGTQKMFEERYGKKVK